jgi:hypothetical protein
MNENDPVTVECIFTLDGMPEHRKSDGYKGVAAQ